MLAQQKRARMANQPSTTKADNLDFVPVVHAWLRPWRLLTWRLATACAACVESFRKSEVRLLMVGLDAAGKTTILYRLKLGVVVTTIPTIGFNVETVKHKYISLTCWDVGGKDKIRPLWRHYYENTQAIIMVVDSNDRDRIGDARDELYRMLGESELQDAALLVFANKQDLPDAMSAAEVAEELGLHRLLPLHSSRWLGRPWYVHSSCATTGDGLLEGLDWLSSAIDPYCSLRTTAVVNGL